MKKIIIVCLLVLLSLSFTSKIYSQCPPNYDGPYTSVFNLCENSCPVEVVWCCFNGAGISPNPSIHLISIKYLLDPLSPQFCPCIEPQPHYPYNNLPNIPFDRLLTGLINSESGCFEDGPPSGIINCDDGWSLQLTFTTGACYRFINTLEFIGYVECEITGIAQCYSSYEICYELINGQYSIRTRPGTPLTPQYNCTGDCISLCDVITF